MNLLNPLRPIARIFPTVLRPISRLNIQQRTVFTAIALFIYLVCSQIPLYGIARSHDSDPLYWARLIMASSRGTLMELGISPIISAGWLTQLLTTVGLFRVTSKEDERDAEGLEGVLAIIFCFGEAVVAIWYGTYGLPSDLPVLTMVLIVAQLMGAGLVVILLDDMLRKGYGLGSGISLFICANTCETICWFAFSPVTMTS
jgi:protein transport protein SEC61 subunit alpha